MLTGSEHVGKNEGQLTGINRACSSLRSQPTLNFYRVHLQHGYPKLKVNHNNGTISLAIKKTVIFSARMLELHPTANFYTDFIISCANSRHTY